MKNKTAAAKVLLEAGWTWEEIEAVLDMTQKPTAIIINQPPAYIAPVYVLPAPPRLPEWSYPIVTCGSISTANPQGDYPTATQIGNAPFTLTQGVIE